MFDAKIGQFIAANPSTETFEVFDTRRDAVEFATEYDCETTYVLEVKSIHKAHVMLNLGKGDKDRRRC